MDYAACIREIIAHDRNRWHMLEQVRSLGLPDSWVAAGFVRNAVWDWLHGREPSAVGTDVDVIWFEPHCLDEAADRALEQRLCELDQAVQWSVKNQARMHARNGDRPYRNAADAMRFWVETATAVAVRLDTHGRLDVAAPLGLGDLFGLVIKPGPRFTGEKHAIFQARYRSKKWLARWPLLAVEGDFPAGRI